MYKVNMWGKNNWWKQQQAKLADWKPPEKCTFCGKEIEDGHFFNAGYDRYKIYSETCDHIYCKQWLEHKVRRKK